MAEIPEIGPKSKKQSELSSPIPTTACKPRSKAPSRKPDNRTHDCVKHEVATIQSVLAPNKLFSFCPDLCSKVRGFPKHQNKRALAAPEVLHGKIKRNFHCDSPICVSKCNETNI
ncbi:AAEL000061-PA [Aedes aegypti]|uniref:AAEL000061-PA n=1 Tax=Aedes aegypti TaxID=7159 RepID=Q0C7B9_AEDAE|nr:AAEL000061-PA [Aedes aegypti]